MQNKITTGLLTTVGATLLGVGLATAPATAQTLLLDGNGEPGDRFGGTVDFAGAAGSLAIDGDWMVVGVPFDTVEGMPQRGSATMFRWVGCDWVEAQELTLPAGQPGDMFGFSVALDGDTLAIGVPYRDALLFEEGAVAVFSLVGDTWIWEAEMTSPTAAPLRLGGFSVAVDQDVIAAGAIGHAGDLGAVDVFRRIGPGQWAFEQQLTFVDGFSSSLMGYSVAVQGDTIFAGEITGPPPGFGRVGVFGFDGSTWGLEQELDATGPGFGGALAIDGDVLAVGTVSSSVVQTYRRTGATWVEEQVIINPLAPSFFGSALDLSGDSLVVGASFDGGAFQGSAFHYRWDGATWAEDVQFVSPAPQPHALMGYAVAVDGARAAVAIPGHDEPGLPDLGAVLIFDVAPQAWSDQGGALAGAFGDPVLEGFGTLVACSDNAVELRDAAPTALTGVFVSYQSSPMAFKSGTLLAFPYDALTLATTDGLGQLSLPFTMPSGAPSGVSVWAQCAVQDAAAIQGASLSNAIRGVTP